MDKVEVKWIIKTKHLTENYIKLLFISVHDTVEEQNTKTQIRSSFIRYT